MRKTIRYFASIVAVSAGLAAVPFAGARAAVVQTDGTGLVTSIHGLAVGLNTYDIAFISGTYAGVFPGGDLFDNAPDLTTAIVDALNASGGPLLSCPAPDCTDFKIPFEMVLADVYIEVGRALTDGSPNPWYDYGEEPDSSAFGAVWAVPAVAAVPVPAALPLFSGALVLLGLMGWRRGPADGA